MKYASSVREAVAPSAAEIAARIESLARMPALLRASVAGRTDTRLRARPGPEPDAFSLHEQVWHLADVEALGYAHRARAIATEEHPFLPDLDGTRLALERRYLDLPLAAGLARFEVARAGNLLFLRALPHAAFTRAGELEGVGCVTLAELLARWCDHDAVHAAEIAGLD